MKNLIILFSVTVFFLLNSGSNAQLSGTKSIPGDYATIADAIAALDSLGVGISGVTFNVAAGHTETSSNLVMAIIGPISLGAPIIFQKSGVGANPQITAAPGTGTRDGIILLSGADNVTFDGIDLLDPVSNTGNAMMEWGYALLRADSLDGSQHNTIKNCNVTLQKINTQSIGIYIINENLAGNVITADSSTGFNNNNQIYGCNVSDVDIGIFAKSTSASRDSNNIIGSLPLPSSGGGGFANTITNWGGGQVVAQLSNGIRCEGQSDLKIINNIVNGGAGTGGGSGVVGIMVTSSGTTGNSADYEISFNTVTVTTGVTSQGTWAIRALGTGDSVLIHHNIVEDCVVNQNTTTFDAINHDAVGTTNFADIHHNIVRNNSHTGTGTSTLLGSEANVTYSHIHDNQVYGNQKSGISGTLICLITGGGTSECDMNEVYNNSIPSSSGASLSAVYGYRNSDSDPATENVHRNLFYNLSVGGSNTSTSSIVAGVRTSGNAGSVRDINDNAIFNLSGVSGTSTSGGVVGVMVANGSSNKIIRNKISNLTNTGSTGTTFGIWIVSGITNQIINNVISDLKTPNSTNANAVVGIFSNSTAANSTIGVYNNSIYLTASGGATFGSSGVSVSANATATTAALDMRHNNIINLSTPGSASGNTVAYRRSAVALANYAGTSDSNNFYAGATAANRLIFFDGTNSDVTLAAYQIRVAPRDANSTTNSSKTLSLIINFEACNETDTILVQIRKSDPPYNVLDTAKGLGGQGNSQIFNFSKPVDGVNYYVVVNHRNSIQTWSKTGGEIFTNGALAYDFTSAASQAFGNNEVLVGSDWSFYTGDVNQNGNVDLSDLIAVFNDAADFVTGYVVTDLNCDDAVTLEDLLFAYNNAANFVEVKRP